MAMDTIRDQIELNEWEMKRGYSPPDVNSSEDVGKPPVSTVIPETAYYPGFGKHGKRINPQGIKYLIPYSSATIEVIRLLNDKAAYKYKDIVEAYKEPECREVIEQLLSHNIKDPAGTYNLLETFRTEGRMTDSIIETIRNRMEDKKIPPMALKTMEDFVLLGFNSEVDIKYKSPKVILEQNALFVALVTNAFTDSIGLDVPLYDANRLGDILSLFGSDPKTRAERRRKAKHIAFYKKHGFGNVHKQTLMDGAVCWYKARVNPGKSVDVWSKTPGMNQPRFSTLIAPYDYANGYPRPR